MADATDLIPVFIHAEPGASVRLSDVSHSCRTLYSEEGGEDYTPLLNYVEALRAAGYRVVQSGARRSGKRPPKMIRDAAWNDPTLAEEAEARRFIAEER
ncbi:hypothetical protein J7E87_13280 [Streptomyces sp. ISL-1]|uniref:hypothetical protein n=1 Tax=Streptomyces sp. ISL-1 TaxID=2817657 RepID=UPI001BE56800|nr:hypothetical protein [Streptomyces sp. ISL-1]MBT2390373.1 hypothetical protein [Streptomyces sp. ISL-1]